LTINFGNHCHILQKKYISSDRQDGDNWSSTSMILNTHITDRRAHHFDYAHKNQDCLAHKK